MPQLNSELPPKLSEAFDRFCKERRLLKREVVAAALYRFMNLPAKERDELFSQFDKWIATSSRRKTGQGK